MRIFIFALTCLFTSSAVAQVQPICPGSGGRIEDPDLGSITSSRVGEWKKSFTTAIARAAGGDNELSMTEVREMALSSRSDENLYADTAQLLMELRRRQVVSVQWLADLGEIYVAASLDAVASGNATSLPADLADDFLMFRPN